MNLITKFGNEDKWICMFAFGILKIIALQLVILIQDFLGKQQLRIFMKSVMNAYLSWMKTNFCRSLLMDLVILAFLDLLHEHRSDNKLSHLINIGTCDCHTIRNSMKHGENSSGWKFNKLLQSMYKIVEEAPKRHKK